MKLHTLSRTIIRTCCLIICIFTILSIEICVEAKPAKSDGIFSALTLPPGSNSKPDSIVVLFHGYGDNAENFLFLGAFLAQFLPSTLFIALNAPLECRSIPHGRQWLKSPKNNKSQYSQELQKLTSSLNKYLDDLAHRFKVSSNKIALLGFSQGTRVALHTGLRRPECPGIVAFSGSYFHDSKAKILYRPPILIIHGINDKDAPVSLARESYKQLKALRAPVTLSLIPGLGHDIDPQGLVQAGKFLQECLYGSE